MECIIGRIQGDIWKITPQAEEDSVVYRVPYKAVSGEHVFSMHLCFLDAEAGDDGYYVIPDADGCFLTCFRERENTVFFTRKNIMPIIGAKFADKAYLVIVEGMRYGYQLDMTVKAGKYSLSLSYDLSKIDLYEDVLLRVVTLTGEDANYSGMARAYRSRAVKEKNLVPLAQRVKTNPVLAYAVTDMPIIRVRMAWKPVPSPVPEQTPETEPPMHVACTFADVELLMEEMSRQGIPKAEICLVGWNVRGHDGRWPQIFPVEEALGGEEGLRKLIARAKQLGYRITCHTNSSDAYRIADCWDPEDIIKQKNGALSVNELAWSGGRTYNLCPKVAYEKHWQKNLPKIKDIGCRGFHYIDVVSIVPPRTCYDPAHPMTAADSARYINKLLGQTRQELGGIASEGGYDFAAANLDFALYIAFRLLSGVPQVADEMIPLWQLVYHGYILSNPSAETVNYPVKPGKHRLRFYEFGGLPVIYLFSRFVGETGINNWMGDEDMYCATPEQRQESVRLIKMLLKEYHSFAPRRLAFMDEHKKLADGVYETVYSDGYRTVVNYSREDYLYGDTTVPAQGMLQLPAEE